MIKIITKNPIPVTKYFAECPYCKSKMECDYSDLMMTYGMVGYLVCPVCKYTIPESYIHSKIVEGAE